MHRAIDFFKNLHVDSGKKLIFPFIKHINQMSQCLYA